MIVSFPEQQIMGEGKTYIDWLCDLIRIQFAWYRIEKVFVTTFTWKRHRFNFIYDQSKLSLD